MSVREMVKQAQIDMRAGGLLPADARNHLVQLTALAGNCMQEMRESESAYNAVLLAQLDGTEAANRAGIRARTTPEYARWREAKDTHALVIEMIRSLKTMLRSLDAEISLTR